MKNVKNILGLFFILILVFTSCDTLELDLTENPNALSPNQADAGFFLNSIQINFGKAFSTPQHQQNNPLCSLLIISGGCWMGHEKINWDLVIDNLQYMKFNKK